MTYKWIKGPDGEYIKNPSLTHVTKAHQKTYRGVVVRSSKKTYSDIPGWSVIRDRILNRDNFSCRICGRDGGEVMLHVHHIDWIREHNDDINLVTLCLNCHKQVHNEGYKPVLYPDWPEPWGPYP
jgi:5-methylcytosine-specific restriction endonuclease McrA